MLHVSACTYAVLRHVNTMNMYGKTLYLPVYVLSIDMPEDDIRTGRKL